MDKSVILKRIGQIAGNHQEVNVAYVYGSYIEHQDFRDIDVALLFSCDLTPYKAFMLAMHIGTELDLGIKIGHDFDVRVLNSAHPEFQYEVVKNGIAIFSRNVQDRFDYEADVISNYLDLKEMYDFFDKEYLARA